MIYYRLCWSVGGLEGRGEWQRDGQRLEQIAADIARNGMTAWVESRQFDQAALIAALAGIQ